VFKNRLCVFRKLMVLHAPRSYTNSVTALSLIKAYERMLWQSLLKFPKLLVKYQVTS